MALQTEHFFLSPVEVIRVTSQNLQEVAEWCGGRVAETESRRVAGRMDSYVWVPTPKGTSVSWAFPGMFITKRLVVTVKNETKVTFAVFRRDYFDKNYFNTPQDAVEKTWGRSNKTMATEKKPKHPKMAGKPRDLELKVTIPPGTNTTEVNESIADAVKVLEEQGVIPAAKEANALHLHHDFEGDVELAALDAIATSGSMSPAEQRIATVEAVIEAETE